ncbi:GxxExxY protein [Pelagicoccus sp. SDUM812002]|uniref:GxxExxY protein n=1 Tax=Pelagicoccus sp. SDUM812002 TaxID=3041266 RepID=UPI0028104F1B|nr:GxxExxY protein [Pelagicoccus sp. SDUM812002]MDQ8188592.1 GxxExxY protein [Pelagicoccus sp. SDUM812002]
MQALEINKLTDTIREASFALHKHLRHGHLEKVYENGLKHRLDLLGIPVTQQHPLPVFDEDGFLLGDFYADLFVAQKIIVELKACKATTNEHVAQLLGYLRSSGKSVGLLINFGAPKLQIKRYLLDD